LTALSLLFAYLIGALPVGYLVARVSGVDIRQRGSGNIGATNVLRTAGWGPAVATLLGDIVKGYGGTWVGSLAGPDPQWAAVAALLVVVGNCWSVFLRFRGGKGVATGLGAFLRITPWALLPAAVVWIALVASFRFVSLASICAVLGLPLAILLLSYPLPFVAVACAVAAIVVASRRTGRRQIRWLAAAGLCMGVAYLMREYVAFMYVALPVFFLLLKIPLRRLVVPAVPMVAVLVFEFVHNAIVYGDPFARLIVAGEHEAPQGGQLALREVLLGFVRGTDAYPMGWVFLIALVLTFVGALATRDRRLILLSVWFLAVWVPFTILGGLLNPVEPSLKLHIERYWFPIYPAIVVGALATIKLAIDRLGEGRRWRRGLAVAALAAIVTGGYLVPALGQVRQVHRDADWRQLRAWLVDHPEVDVIYTDERTGQVVPFYARTESGKILWDGSFRTFRRQAEVLPAEIGHSPYLQTKFGAREHPDPADGWRMLWRSDNGVLTLWQR